MTNSPKLGSLCAGYGGLEMGLTLAGVEHELVWYAENDQHASKVMVHHHPDAPNLGDLTQITDPPTVGIVTAGFPCQPFSVAGARKGVTDERWLIDDVCRVARTAGAHTLVLENVTGLLSANDGDAMARVCQALAVNGFDRWRWTTLRASDVGAPHGRNRWFCVAVQDAYGEPRDQRGFAAPGQEESGRARADSGRRDRAPTADTDRIGRQLERIGGLPQDAEPQPRRDADGCDRARFGGYAEAVHRWEYVTGRPAPDPTNDGRLSPTFVEWMMGLPEGWVTDLGLVNTDPRPNHLSRAQMLKILGNGVVPQQAAAAITQLAGNPTK